MNPYLIRRLAPSDAELLIHYFQTLDYHHQPEWQTCYCQFYHQDCSMDQWIEQSKHGKNEAITCEDIQSGRMHGYLIFDGELLIGWLNANHYQRYLRLVKSLHPYLTSPYTAVMICFVIHPDYRGQGVARQLLQYAIHDLHEQGYQSIIALPREDPHHPEHRYRGTFHMYEGAGFTLVNEELPLRIYRYSYEQ